MGGEAVLFRLLERHQAFSTRVGLGCTLVAQLCPNGVSSPENRTCSPNVSY
jgi:hypothetical protein